MRLISSEKSTWMLGSLLGWGATGLVACTALREGGSDMQPDRTFSARIFQTSQAGDRLTDKGALVLDGEAHPAAFALRLEPEQTFQTILGFGGAFTEASAEVLSRLAPEKRQEIVSAYFGRSGAWYSLNRVHLGSCDFSVHSYSYAEREDPSLGSFSLEEDERLLIPLIRQALDAEEARFKLFGSPWTAPPWMKENRAYYTKGTAENGYRGFGGKLKKEHYPTFALYLARAVQAYRARGLPMWGLTPVNEPGGVNGNWESMEFRPEEMRDFIKQHLGPRLAREAPDTRILMFDHNRDGVVPWAEAILQDQDAARYVAGTAVHWYAATEKVFEEELDRVREIAPDKLILNSEACIDSLGDDEGALAWWKNDAWWWEKNATDWGFRWAEDKSLHPRYEPVFRYARDLIQGLNHWMSAWVDWNLVLDKRGGPNHEKNFCGAPIMVDPDTEEIHYTPLYFIMAHFSRFIRPEAVRIGLTRVGQSALWATAARNQDGSVVLEVFNPDERPAELSIALKSRSALHTVPPLALQTLVFGP